MSSSFYFQLYTFTTKIKWHYHIFDVKIYIVLCSFYNPGVIVKGDDSFMLKYNIDFEIMGMMIMLVMIYFFHANYDISTRSAKAFSRLMIYILIAEILDITTAFTFSLEDPRFNLINLILNTAYYMNAAATAVGFEGYITSYIEVVVKNKTYDLVRRAIFVIYVIHGLTNPFTKLAFYFDENGLYQHGPLYILGYVIPALYMVSALYHIIRYRECFEKKRWISSVTFIFVVFIVMFFQAFFLSDIYLTYGLIPVALLIILFTLETPDYRKLMNTLDELEVAKQEAWHANQVKTDFLANMSHEIRTPINAVLGFDEMILRESNEDNTLKYATNIKSSGQSLLSLINDILDLSKIEAGKMDIIPQEYDIVEMVSTLVKQVAPRANDKGLSLNLDIDSKIPRKLVGDDVRISQVLTNLLTNAVKYTQKGEITFQIKAEKPADKEVYLLFAVRDTGVGIKEENTAMLFSEFSRIEDSNSRAIEGTGLGLPISMKFLNLMGSRLEVKSVFGEGSVFYFFLTQKVADAEPIGDFEQAREKLSSSVSVFRENFTAPDAHVLVVDDVDMNLKVFAGLLNKSRLKIDTASSGAEAIEMIKENDYDCIFMDHQMPVMDGIETLEKLQSDPEFVAKKTPVVALTANAISGAREMYLSKGFSDYLSKPINGWELSEILFKWLPKDKIIDAEDEILEFMPSGESYDYSDVTGTITKLEELGVDVRSGLVYAMDDEDFYLELLEDFMNSSDVRIAELNDRYSEKEWKDYEIKVHALKSLLKTIGMNNLSEEAKDLEMASKNGDEAFIESNHNAFVDHYMDMITKFEGIIGE